MSLVLQNSKNGDSIVANKRGEIAYSAMLFACHAVKITDRIDTEQKSNVLF